MKWVPPRFLEQILNISKLDYQTKIEQQEAKYILINSKKIFDCKKPSYAAKYLPFSFVTLGKLNLTPS